MPGAKAWTEGEFTLPADANNQAAVYVRWIADKTSSVKGTTGTNDGIAIAQIYITGTAQLFNDGTGSCTLEPGTSSRCNQCISQW